MNNESGYWYMDQWIPNGESHMGVYTETIFEQMKQHWARKEFNEYDIKLTALFAGDRVDIELAKNICDMIGRTR